MKRIIAVALMMAVITAASRMRAGECGDQEQCPPTYKAADMSSTDKRLADNPTLIRYSVTERRKIELTNDVPLILSEISGGIFVRPGAKTEISLKGIKTAYSDNMDVARLEAGRLEIAVSAPSDRVDISTKLPARRGAGKPGCIDYNVRVPSAMQLRLKTVSGEINAARLDGSVTAESVSGNVGIRDVKGPVAAKTVAGDMEIVNCPETIQLASRAGRIDFEVDKLTAPSLDIESKSGDIHVTFPDSLNATIEISSVSGQIDVSGDVLKEIEERDGARRFIAGKGESMIRISTINGKISIIEDKEANPRFPKR